MSSGLVTRYEEDNEFECNQNITPPSGLPTEEQFVYAPLPMGPKFINITGCTFGKWTVLGYLGLQRTHGMWHCRCECGVERSIQGATLRNGNSKSCSCKKFEDLTGMIFGFLTVVEFSGINNDYQKKWTCICVCGNTKIIVDCSLKSGGTKSCGCFSRKIAAESSTTHGFSYHPLHHVWTNMIRRCTNTTDKNYPNYGGRGITVCERWMSFENFIADIGEIPFEGATLERIDNNLGYCPENVRWATRKEQGRNKRNNVFLEFNGEKLCISEWAEKTGIPQNAISYRIKNGWSIERTLTSPAY